jgi:hypothetical protein
MSIHNIFVYFGHSRTKTTYGTLRNIPSVQWKHENIQHKKLIQTLKCRPNTWMTHVTWYDTNLTSPPSSPLSSFNRPLYTVPKIIPCMCSETCTMAKMITAIYRDNKTIKIILHASCTDLITSVRPCSIAVLMLSLTSCSTLTNYS